MTRTIRGAGLGMLLAVLVCLNSTEAALAQKGAGKNLLRSSPLVVAAFHDVVAKPSQSTVRIQCDGKDVALGTIVGTDGWILTKYSELTGLPTCKLKDGREFEARVVGVHDRCDLAMLKIEVKGLIAVDFSESKVAPVGNWVASPGIGDKAVAIGVVSVASRNLIGKGAGPAPNPTSGFLGVGLDLEADGVKINQVIKDTAAEKTGLKVNDMVLTVNGEKVENADAFINILQRRRAGDVVKLKVKRGDKELELEATLGKRPQQSSRGDFQNSLGSELSNRRTGFTTILQHDSVIKPHDCGGPLVDLDGHVIGINVARAGRTESYAIPAETLLPLIPDLKSGKLAPVSITRKPGPSTEDLHKLAEAKAALQKAESDKADADKRVAEAKAALERLQAQLDKKGAKDAK